MMLLGNGAKAKQTRAVHEHVQSSGMQKHGRSQPIKLPLVDQSGHVAAQLHQHAWVDLCNAGRHDALDCEEDPDDN